MLQIHLAVVSVFYFDNNVQSAKTDTCDICYGKKVKNQSAVDNYM